MTTAQDSSAQQALHWHYAAELDDRNFQIGGRTVFFIIVLFSVTITVTLLLLYARWAFRYNNDSLVPAHAPPQPDPAAASHLPITLHRSSSSGEELECCICLGVVEDGEKVKVLPECRHCYHSECVDRWLVARSSCPMCRTPIRAGSYAPLAIVVVTESE